MTTSIPAAVLIDGAPITSYVDRIDNPESAFNRMWLWSVHIGNNGTVIATGYCSSKPMAQMAASQNVRIVTTDDRQAAQRQANNGL